MDEGEMRRHAWVLPALSWGAVSKARARIAGSVEQAPSHVGDIELRSLNRELFAWWMEIRKDRIMPGPEDIDPKALVELLPYFRMLRWESEDALVFRIYGSALAEVVGFDLTGMNSFAEGDYAGKREDIARLKLMHAQPCGLLLWRDIPRADGSFCTSEFINLPVSADADGCNRIVGTIVPCKEVAETDLHFSLTRPLTVRRAVFIDIGAGVPDEAAALSV
jgi:hypothetical protein